MGGADDWLPLSGIQHFCFCRRQWALIHLEQQWAENRRTVEGQLDHTRCHDANQTERRGGLLITRGMQVVSRRLGLSGNCDVVEFRADPEASDADRLQLCAQAMALEEMLVCSIPEGALFYEETRRREVVPLTEELRQATQKMADEMHAYFARGYTPKSKPGTHCNACSLKELCLPVLYQRADPKAYLRAHLDEMQEAAP